MSSTLLLHTTQAYSVSLPGLWPIFCPRHGASSHCWLLYIVSHSTSSLFSGIFTVSSPEHCLSSTYGHGSIDRVRCWLTRRGLTYPPPVSHCCFVLWIRRLCNSTVQGLNASESPEIYCISFNHNARPFLQFRCRVRGEKLRALELRGEDLRSSGQSGQRAEANLRTPHSAPHVSIFVDVLDQRSPERGRREGGGYVSGNFSPIPSLVLYWHPPISAMSTQRVEGWGSSHDGFHMSLLCSCERLLF